MNCQYSGFSDSNDPDLPGMTPTPNPQRDELIALGFKDHAHSGEVLKSIIVHTAWRRVIGRGMPQMS